MNHRTHHTDPVSQSIHLEFTAQNTPPGLQGIGSGVSRGTASLYQHPKSVLSAKRQGGKGLQDTHCIKTPLRFHFLPLL